MTSLCTDRPTHLTPSPRSFDRMCGLSECFQIVYPRNDLTSTKTFHHLVGEEIKLFTRTCVHAQCRNVYGSGREFGELTLGCTGVKVTDMVMVMMAVVKHVQHQQHENGESDRYGDGDDGSGAT